jgi:hypothetical protein
MGLPVESKSSFPTATPWKSCLSADPLESFKIYKDTTFAMMREAQRRGHTIVACEPQQLLWQRGGWCRPRCAAITLTGDAKTGSRKPHHIVRARHQGLWRRGHAQRPAL